jgi:transposase
MRQIRAVLQLKYRQQFSHEKIAQALGLSKGVIAKYLKRLGRSGLTGEQLLELGDDDLSRHLQVGTVGEAQRVLADYGRVHAELKRKGVTLRLLWQEHQAAHAGQLTCGYTKFTEDYHQYVAGLRRSMRQVHRGGEKLFIDYAGMTVPYGDGQRAQVFVAVLGASNYTFACATARQTLQDWIGSVVRALEYIQGVPALLVPDNARALIADADRYEPQASATVLEMAEHYHTTILPARPYHPKDKSKVEVGVQIVERWILARLRNQRFVTLAEVDGAIGDLLEDLNTRAFKKLSGNRVLVYLELDKPFLKPLPASRYEFARHSIAKVNIDYHVEFQRHYYSVPHALVRQSVQVRATAHTVEILHHGKRVAAHVRSDRAGKHTTLPAHMPAAHRAHLQWSPGRLINWGQRIGPACAALITRILESRPHPEQGYRACLGLLRLDKAHGSAALEGACARALALGSASYRTVQAILKRAQHTVALQDELTWNTPEHGNVRGPGYYH